MNFSLDKEKAIEALVYIASRVPGVGRFHAAKMLYFAEREHLRTFGRPIVGDQYVAMENGPVPSFVYRVMKNDLAQADRLLAAGAVVEGHNGKHPTYTAGREARMDYFSRTDIRCLDHGIEHCRDRKFGQISDETHDHLAWLSVGTNADMRFSDFLDGVDEEIVDYARTSASHGVL